MRDTQINIESIKTILNDLINKHQNDWLLTLEICELVKDENKDIYNVAYQHLMSIIDTDDKYKKLILDGLKII